MFAGCLTSRLAPCGCTEQVCCDAEPVQASLQGLLTCLVTCNYSVQEVVHLLGLQLARALLHHLEEGLLGAVLLPLLRPQASSSLLRLLPLGVALANSQPPLLPLEQTQQVPTPPQASGLCPCHMQPCCQQSVSIEHRSRWIASVFDRQCVVTPGSL